MARPRLGQHFLIKGSILDRIAAAACPTPGEAVIEIGPGRGALTGKLLQRAARVVAVELDASLAAHLRRKFSGEPRLEVVEADVLETDLARFGRAAIAGNLPYYIASAIVEKAVRLTPPRAVFLIQKEVALRLCARPGEREYGYLTVRTAAFAGARLLFAVAPGAFRPPPQVDSAVVALEPRPTELQVDDADAFLRFVGRCFQYKRKTIRNNLAGIYGKERVDAWPEAASRAEQLSLEQFAAMYRRIIAPTLS
ncbi:MAG: 16S rRNA (adenine(1518)-N(6)/adenine(1519)-N(6))-dimethyltransferase RsmA [Bryobacteraceae bacterium]